MGLYLYKMLFNVPKKKRFSTVNDHRFGGKKRVVFCLFVFINLN